MSISGFEALYAARLAQAPDTPWPDSAYVCARMMVVLEGTLRCVQSLCSGGYIIQGGSLATSLIEHAHVIMWVGGDDDRAKAWLAHEGEKSGRSVALRRSSGVPSTRHGDRSVQLLQHRTLSTSRRRGAKRSTASSRCEHGNPKILRGFGVKETQDDHWIVREPWAE